MSVLKDKTNTPVYPDTFIQNITDRDSGKTLAEILNSFNMYYIPYLGSCESTRLQVLSLLRRKGLWLSYCMFDGTLRTEYYNGNSTDDDSWKDSKNWNTGSNMLVGNISINVEGNWVINGYDTGITASGDTTVVNALEALTQRVALLEEQMRTLQ